MKRSSLRRAASELSKSLNHQLSMYALAAGAAGVGFLALAPRADAKIIYTPKHAKVTDLPLPVDLNHDGVVDFYLINDFPHHTGDGSFLSVCQNWETGIFSTYCSFRGTNAVRTIDSKGAEYAAALRSGDKVQRGRFAKGRVILGSQPYYRTMGSKTSRGPWFNGGKGVKNRYLGLKFKIKGRFHFGWARMTVTPSPHHKGGTATLTGYAYETIPGKGIVAGQTKGPDVFTVEPGTLGGLALGRK